MNEWLTEWQRNQQAAVVYESCPEHTQDKLAWRAFSVCAGPIHNSIELRLSNQNTFFIFQSLRNKTCWYKKIINNKEQSYCYYPGVNPFQITACIHTHTQVKICSIVYSNMHQIKWWNEKNVCVQSSAWKNAWKTNLWGSSKSENVFQRCIP